jgi:branched-chain amino acid transport system permease protein
VKALPSIAIALLALVFLLVPVWVQSPYALHIFILLFAAIAIGEGWNVIGGLAGQYSVGHAAFSGVGAYATFILLQYRQIAPWYGVFIAIAIAVVIALIIGSITFRLRGPYFVLASIAVAEIVRLAALNWKSLTNGAEGILASDLPPLKLGTHVITDWNGKLPYYYLGLAMAAFSVLVLWLVKRSKLGFYLQAIREDQDAAHSLGISPSLNKNAGLAISAAVTALTGAFAALYVGFIEPDGAFGLDTSIQAVLICISGGVGTVWGPVVGAVLITLLSEALRANLIAQLFFALGVSQSSHFGAFLNDTFAHAHVLIRGLLLIAVILYMPDGVIGLKLLKRRKR